MYVDRFTAGAVAGGFWDTEAGDFFSGEPAHHSAQLTPQMKEPGA
jgi:hypothetical protein